MVHIDTSGLTPFVETPKCLHRKADRFVSQVATVKWKGWYQPLQKNDQRSDDGET